MKKRIMLLLTCLFAMVSLVTAQVSKVSGTVISEEDGQPVVGASVLVKGTTLGTITDMDGKFALTNVPSSARTLVVSYVGMKTAEVAMKSVVNVTLVSDAELLDELVVVGYGTQRKKDLTSAISKVETTSIANSGAASFDSQLAGKAAGVQVSSANGALGTVPQYQVRGISSMSSDTQPLIVIDGMPMVSGDMGESSTYNSMSDINPSDIESLEILKDGAATAIYGSRAANGVVLITTKRGAKGALKFSYDGALSLTSASKKYDLLNAQQFVEVMDQIYGNWGMTSPAVYDGTDTNWQDYVYRNAFQQSHTLSASGGTDKAQYYFSLGYTDQDGIVRGNELNRFSAKSNVDMNVNKWLKVGFNVQATRTRINGMSNSENSLGAVGFASVRMLPNVAVFNDKDETGYNVDSADRKSLGRGSNTEHIGNNISNIVWILDNNVYRNTNSRMIGGGYAQITFMKGLTFKTQGSVDYTSAKGYTYWNPDSGDGYSYGGLIDESNASYSTWNWQNILDFNHTWNGVHNLSATAVQEYNYSSYEYTEAEVLGLSDKFFSDHIISNTFETPSIYGSKTFHGMASYMLRANYNFDSKYYVGASIRRDGLSRLSKDSRWGNFYGVSGAWRISREKFWNENYFFNDLRLRASYATIGNSEVGSSNFPYLGTYGSKGYGSQKGIAWTNMGNNNLAWESTGTYDLGIDGAFMNNRFTFELAYWKKDSKDLVMQISTDPSMGIPYNYYYANNGKVSNSGIEFQISGDIIRTKDFSWNANLNFSTLHNEVKELNDHIDVYNDDYTISREGEAFRSLYGYEYYGVNKTNGNPIWYKADGSLVQFDTFGDYDYKVYDPSNPSDVSKAAYLDPNSDRKILGTTIPTWFGGLTNTFKYKDFDASFLLRYSGGNKVMNVSRQQDLLSLEFCNMSTESLNYWKSETDPGDGLMPKLGYGDGAYLFNQGFTDSHFVENGSFLKLASMSFGYTLPKNLVKKFDMTSIRFYVQGTNLLTITGYKGLDPETRSSSSTRQGVDYGSMPQARTFTFGANITF